MKVYAFPADNQGCGFYRVIAPSEALKDQGVDVEVVGPENRSAGLSGVLDGDNLVGVNIPDDADLIVFQRVTHKHILQAIPLIRARGVAVITEIDDDLTCIDPRNPAFDLLQPNSKTWPEHSWHNTVDALKASTLVVCSTPALARRFGSHTRVWENHVPSRYLDIPRVDSRMVGWGGSVHSHPADLQVMGNSMARLAGDGWTLGVVGNGEGVHEAWGLPGNAAVHASGVVPLDKWPDTLSKLGVGVAPLADTKFNAAKSWLKMAEMAAVGVPCVGSPRAEYSRLYARGVGALAEGKDWYRKLKFLLENDNAREELSQSGRYAMSGLTIEGNAWKLAEIWHEAVSLQRR